jgi:hypothetical protein
MKKEILFCCAAFLAAVVLCVSCMSTPKEELELTEETAYTIVESGTTPTIDGQVELTALIEDYRNTVYQSFQDEIEENIEAAKLTGDTHWADGKTFTFDISSSTGRHDAQFYSILLDIEWNSGGAHGAQVLKSFLWDVKAKKLVLLNDVLSLAGFSSLAALSTSAKNELEKSLNPGGADTNLSSMIADGTKPTEKNFEVFLLENSLITFYFQRYQTAPGASGVQKVSFPVKQAR